MNRVDDFLARLASQAPKAKETFESKNRSLEKVYLNFPGNFGRYQIFPIDNVVTDYPFVTLFGTREINIPRKSQNQDGTENVYNAWIKILPKEAYIMRDMTGRVVSSLSAGDETLLDQAYMIFDQLYEALDVKNNRNVPEIVNLLRKRNYTIFHAFCVNKWDPNESRNPSRQNFSALFACTAKNFTGVVEDNIQEKILMKGGDTSWINSIYNRLPSGRDGFLMFSIGPRKDGQAGFQVTASHEVGTESLKTIQIPEEDLQMMTDPLSSFLGWQANKDDQNSPQCRRLFNSSLIREAIEFMSHQLASVRAAMSNSMDIKEAIKNTNEEALASFPVNNQRVTNDPMLNAMGGSNTAGMSASRIVENNNDPYSTPPVSHVDPVTGAPIQSGGFNGGQWSVGQPVSNNTVSPKEDIPFTPNPGFGNFEKFGQGGSSNEKGDDLPF